MSSSDERRPEQAAETQRVEERNLPHLLLDLAEKFGDGTMLGAGTVVGKKAAEKVLGGHGQGKHAGKPAPPADPPPAQTE